MPSDARASFSTTEIVRVLEVFGIGGLQSLAELPAGSRRAAKLVANCTRGSYLLKRREVQQGAGVERVRYACSVHRHAIEGGVPCAPLMTTAEGDPVLVEGTFVYEVQGFVQGQRFAYRHDQATAVGAALARLHGALASFRGGGASPALSYCRNPTVVTALRTIASRATTAAQGTLCEALIRRYEAAAAHRWPELACVTHSDCHPGNVLLDGARVVAIIDFDSARVAPLVTDLANAALQFGLPPVVGSDPSAWEPRFNEHCLRALVRGYRAERKPPTGTSASIPPLMIQAAIAEVAAPVARRGTFGPIDGWAMLGFVDRKTRWIEESAAGIATLCGA
jgi:Ser/Thr protein kinase RdoA (MazF antagonist)